MRKQIITAGLATAVGVTGLVGVNAVNAVTGTTTDSTSTTQSSTTNPMSSLVDAIASKFGLDKTKVQAVFDEQRTAMEAEREAEVKKDVAQLVTDGKLTQKQADAINAKRAELQKEREANRETFKDLTADERKAKMDENKTALEKWATDNNISTDYLRYVMGGGRGHGPGGPGGMRGDDAAKSDTSSDTSTSN